MTTPPRPNKSTNAPTASWMDYVKLARLHMFPVGNDHVIMPCLWGLAMAAKSQNMPFIDIQRYIIPLIIGATCVHSAACVLSDICDVDFDRQVERTKLRPLCTGAVSMAEAWALIFVLLLPCAWLLRQTNQTAAALALFGLFPLHTLYPLSKRWMKVPQIMLGLTMNWGYLVGWACVTGSVNLKTSIIFMAGATSYGIVYDTIYGCQDREDDVKAGVNSAALFFGDKVRPILMVFAAVWVICLSWAGNHNGQGVYYYAAGVAPMTVLLMWIFNTWKPEDKSDCLSKFKAAGSMSVVAGLGMFLDLHN